MQFRNFITTPRESSAASANTPKAFSYYKSGVRVKFPKKGPPLRCQILPAYDPSNPSNSQGFAQCLSNGMPTAWFGMIQSAKFVGHGDWKSTLPILSLASFEGNEPCPYLKLLNYCKNNPDWKYLVTKTSRWGQADYQDAILKPVKSVLLLNIVDVDDPGKGVQIAEMSYSVANTLLNQESGIVFQRNLQLDSYPNAAAALAQDPMLAYANGDITRPDRAPVFVIELPPVKAGSFGAGYTARIEVTNGQVSRRVASDIEMSSRYHLDDPESFLNIPTGQDIVNTLVTLLKGHTSPKGFDETCVIKEAVGDMYRVDTVSAPGAVSTVQGWSAEKTAATAAPSQTYQQPVPQPAPQPAPQAQVYQQPVQAPATPTAPAAPAGFAPNPATASAPAGNVMAIPGETPPGANAELAQTLAARLRSQISMRK